MCFGKRKSQNVQPIPAPQPPILNAVAALMPAAPPIDADGSKMTRGEWDAYVAAYGKFPTTPAAPPQPRVVPVDPPLVTPPRSPYYEDNYDWGSQAALDEHRARVRARDENLRKWGETGVSDATGPYPVENMLPIEDHADDWRFLYWLCTYSTKYGDASRRMLRGKNVDIARGIGWAHTNSNTFDPVTYSGPLQAVIIQVYGKA